MSPVMVSPGMLEEARRLHGAALVHAYTRVPTVAALDEDDRPIYDDWGGATVTSGTPVVGNRCLFVPRDQQTVDERGRLTLSQPILRVPHDDPLRVGDLVRDVVDQEGRALLSIAAVVAYRAVPNRGGCVTAVAELQVIESDVTPPGGS